MLKEKDSSDFSSVHVFMRPELVLAVVVTASHSFMSIDRGGRNFVRSVQPLMVLLLEAPEITAN
jgi:hypothetical protein